MFLPEWPKLQKYSVDVATGCSILELHGTLHEAYTSIRF